ncbi:response regulator [Lysobacter korlensis]|uniref:Response regulator n=1 Tax=Lysobacter korlensis TaxID=553636 RepID=A0ABV6RYA7_9GAMM
MGVPDAPGRGPVRLAVLDDHEVLLDSLTSWIGANAPDFNLVLCASTWPELVHSAHFPTDIVFLDFQLKEPVSIEARVRTCRAAGAKVVVLSAHDSDEIRDRALAAGAEAFVSKVLPLGEVMNVARGVLGMARSEGGAPSWRPLPAGAEEAVKPKLSTGEAQALSLYASGLSAVEVADRMDVQYETVKTFLRRVREKYARVGRPASRKAELIRRAAEDGYLI